MKSREAKRKSERVAESVKKNAKQDMLDFVSELNRLPSNEEILAWQNGYIAGINRANANQ